MEYVDGKPQRFDDGIQDARHERIHEKHLQDERRSADKGNVEHDELFCLSFSASTHSLLRHQKSRHKREVDAVMKIVTGMALMRKGSASSMNDRSSSILASYSLCDSRFSAKRNVLSRRIFTIQ